MSYIDYEYYTTKYDSIEQASFNRVLFDAERKIDNATTGIDGVRKLQIAFPTDERNAEIVRMTVCKVVDLINQIREAEIQANEQNSIVDGHYNLISSMSAGSESVSYVTGSTIDTSITAVLSDKAKQDTLINDVITEYLQGVTDDNGVYLLYMGNYPV